MLRRITEIIFSFMLIITFTGCSNSIQESTISKEESTQMPSLPYEKPLDESDSTDKVLLDNINTIKVILDHRRNNANPLKIP